jgi:hypothetical protein
MKILILHRVPFAFLQYDQLIDHAAHEVIYLGAEDRLDELPPDLRAVRIPLLPGQDHAPHVEQSIEAFRGVQRVVSASQYTLRDAARIREAIDCPGMRVDAFDAVDDKVVMKARIRALGLRAPAFMSYPQFLEAQDSPWTGKTVLKPRCETASRNVSVFANPQMLLAAAERGEIPDQPAAESMQVEEFIEGPILHFDGFAREGEIVLIQPSRYHGTCLGYARGESLGSLQFDDQALAEAATGYVRACGIADGAFHLEMIQTETGLCFLEIAPRVGGGGINDVMRLRWGIDLVAADIATQAGMEPPAYASRATDERYGFYIVPGHPHVGSRCTVRFDYPERARIVTETAIGADETLGADITHNAGEVPLYLIVRQDLAIDATTLMDSIAASIDIQYSKE